MFVCLSLFFPMMLTSENTLETFGEKAPEKAPPRREVIHLTFSFLHNKLSPRRCSHIHRVQCNRERLGSPSCQCQPRLAKVFLSSSRTSHRVNKQTLPSASVLNKAALAGVMRPSQSGHRYALPVSGRRIHQHHNASPLRRSQPTGKQFGEGAS